MYTDIEFVNRSLNPNVSRVGVFLGELKRIPSPDGGEKILLWEVIRNCNFLRHHPLRVYWDGCSGTTSELQIKRISFCADINRRVGEVVRPGDLNLSLQSFNLLGLRSMTVFMKGGTPGPDCTALRFVATDFRS